MWFGCSKSTNRKFDWRASFKTCPMAFKTNISSSIITHCQLKIAHKCIAFIKAPLLRSTFRFVPSTIFILSQIMSQYKLKCSHLWIDSSCLHYAPGPQLATTWARCDAHAHKILSDILLIFESTALRLIAANTINSYFQQGNRPGECGKVDASILKQVKIPSSLCLAKWLLAAAGYSSSPDDNKILVLVLFQFCI